MKVAQIRIEEIRFNVTFFLFTLPLNGSGSHREEKKAEASHMDRCVNTAMISFYQNKAGT